MRVKIDGNQVGQVYQPSEACDCRMYPPDSREQADERVFKLDLNIKAEVGDTIMVEYPAKGIVQTMLALYGLPSLGLFLGYFLAYNLTGAEAFSALAALGGLVVCWLAARPVARLIDGKIGQPRIVATVCRQ